MAPKKEALYLDLLKKTLSFSLWAEPPTPLETYNYLRSPIKRPFVSLLLWALRKKRIRLMRDPGFSEEDRTNGKIWPGYADTMIGMRRLNNIQTCVEQVLADDIPGDLIETGVWRGGACILMRAVLAVNGIADRKVFVADSFEGLPKPDVVNHPKDKGDDHHFHKIFIVSQEEVAANFKRYGLLDEQVVFIAGFFSETLPVAPINSLAVLRLDGDMYGSTMVALESLYPKLSPGGFCIIDDYALRGCRAAVDEFRAIQNIKSEMVEIDWTGRYWRKE